MTDRLLLVLLALMLGSTALAVPPGGEEILVAQKNREFAVQEVVLAAGGRISFSNEDEFPHQISAKGPGVATSSPLQRPGEVLQILLPQPGLVQVRCGIHPRMRLAIRVE
jgi:plastocyanin